MFKIVDSVQMLDWLNVDLIISQVIIRPKQTKKLDISKLHFEIN